MTQLDAQVTHQLSWRKARASGLGGCFELTLTLDEANIDWLEALVDDGGDRLLAAFIGDSILIRVEQDLTRPPVTLNARYFANLAASVPVEHCDDLNGALWFSGGGLQLALTDNGRFVVRLIDDPESPVLIIGNANLDQLAAMTVELYNA